MSIKEICEKIIGIAYENIGVELNANEDLKIGGVDSLSVVLLISEVENAFDITFSDDDLDPDNLDSIINIARLVKKYL